MKSLERLKMADVLDENAESSLEEKLVKAVDDYLVVKNQKEKIFFSLKEIFLFLHRSYFILWLGLSRLSSNFSWLKKQFTEEKSKQNVN